MYIILEQQVSLASARAAFLNLQKAIHPVNAQNFLTLDAPQLKRIGFSRQKSGYGINLARLITTGKLDLDHLSSMNDNEVREILIGIKGIGHWTADIYLLMALDRRDIWPSGDLALNNAFRQVKNYSNGFSGEEIKTMAAAWRPWRSVAARILWNYYISERNKNRQRKNPSAGPS
jgi:DNA-3-methyladenine glycosylase II